MHRRGESEEKRDVWGELTERENSLWEEEVILPAYFYPFLLPCVCSSSCPSPQYLAHHPPPALGCSAPILPPATTRVQSPGFGPFSSVNESGVRRLHFVTHFTSLCIIIHQLHFFPSLSIRSCISFCQVNLPLVVCVLENKPVGFNKSFKGSRVSLQPRTNSLP